LATLTTCPPCHCNWGGGGAHWRESDVCQHVHHHLNDKSILGGRHPRRRRHHRARACTHAHVRLRTRTSNPYPGRKAFSSGDPITGSTPPDSYRSTGRSIGPAPMRVTTAAPMTSHMPVVIIVRPRRRTRAALLTRGLSRRGILFFCGRPLHQNKPTNHAIASLGRACKCPICITKRQPDNDTYNVALPQTHNVAHNMYTVPFSSPPTGHAHTHH